MKTLISRIVVNKLFFPFIAFVLPIIFYFGVITGNSFGLECAGSGLMGINPPYQQEYNTANPYCSNISDIGAYAWHHYPNWVKAARQYLELSFPLWNQNNGIGTPLAANLQSSVYFIPNIIFAMPNSVISFDIYFIFRFSIVSLGMYFFLRSFQIPKPLSLIGSLVVFLNGYFTYIPTIAHVNVDIMLPWIGFFLNTSFQTKQIKHFILFALTFAVSTLGASPESSIFIALFAGLYIFFLSFFIEQNQRLKLFAFYCSFIFLSFLISTILIIPAIEYVLNGSSLHHPGASQFYSSSVWSTISWAFPRIFGDIPTTTKIVGGLGIGPWSGGYFGTFTFFFLISAFFLILLRHKELIKEVFAKHYFFFSVLFTFLVVQYFSITPNLLSHLPAFSQTNYVKYSQSLINFLAATISIFTIHYLIRYKSKLVVILSSITMLLFIGFIYFKLKEPLGSFLMESQIQNFQSFSKQLKFSTGIIIVLSLLLYFKNRFLKNRILLWILFSIAAFELFIYLPLDGDIQRRDSFRKPPFIDFLQSQNYEESRIFSPDYILYPDTSALFDLNDVRNLDALWPKYYYNYLKEFVVTDIDKAAFRFTGIKENGTSKNAHVSNNPFFDLLSVKYSLTYNPIENYENLEPLNSFLEQLTTNANVSASHFLIDGTSRPVIFEHPPNKIEVRVKKPKKAVYFYLYPALSQKVFNDETKGSDGVSFSAQAKKGSTVLFEDQLNINPKQNKEEQKWFEIRFGPFPQELEEFSLVLQTDPLRTTINDWAGWGGFEWDTEKDIPLESRYKKIYDKEIKIYEYEGFVPRLHPISEVKCAENESDIFPLMKTYQSQITNMGIVFDKNCQEEKFGTKDVKITKQSFDDQKVSFDYSSPEPSYIILSNLYFPGWKLKLNGKEMPIERANYTFQGIRLPAVKNAKVEVIYDPNSFKLGLALTIMAFLVSGVLFFKFGGRKIDSFNKKMR